MRGTGAGVGGPPPRALGPGDCVGAGDCACGFADGLRVARKEDVQTALVVAKALSGRESGVRVASWVRRSNVLCAMPRRTAPQPRPHPKEFHSIAPRRCVASLGNVARVDCFRDWCRRSHNTWQPQFWRPRQRFCGRRVEFEHLSQQSAPDPVPVGGIPTVAPGTQ